MNDSAFRQWLTDNHGLTAEESAYAPTQFLRSDDWFDVNAHELWLMDRYREYTNIYFTTYDTGKYVDEPKF